MHNPNFLAIESELQDFCQKYRVSERKFKIISNINFLSNLYTIAKLVNEKVSTQEALKLYECVSEDRNHN